jgi:uncharacterized membrane protein YgcG
MYKLLKTISILILLLRTWNAAYAQNEIPVLRQRVSDFTNTLSFTQWKDLESSLQRFEDSTSNQVAIL